ncbi:zinc finger, CCHC-type containing protein [Tanacetum coccineum]
MDAAAMKHMASNFAKLCKFEGVDFRRWQKKMHFLLSSMSVVYVLTTPMPEYGGDNPTVEQVRKRTNWDNDDYVCRGLILNGMSDPLFDIYQNIESSKELWNSLEAKYMAEDASSKKFLDSDKPNSNNVASPSFVNMVEHNNFSRYNDNKGKRKHHDNTRADPNKKDKSTCWKCGKTSHIKRDCKGANVGNKDNGSCTKGSVDGSYNSLKEATVHVCKDRCWFKTYESLNNGSILYMGNESTALVYGCGYVDLRVPNKRNMITPYEVWRKRKQNLDLPPWFEVVGKLLQTSWLQIDLQKKTKVARISTIRLLIAMASIYNLIIHQMDVKTAFLNGDLDEEVDLTKEFLSSRFSMKDMGEANIILVSNPMDISEKLMPNNGQVVSQREYSKVIGCLMYAMTCTRPDISFAVGKLSRYTSNTGTQHWQTIQPRFSTEVLKKTMDYRIEIYWLSSVLEGYTIAAGINNTKDLSSISGCVITLAKAYSQMYNGKSRHLGVRHSMIRELITNEVISIKLVRSQQNLVDHLMKGLARVLVIKSAEGMGLKWNIQWTEALYLHIIPRMCLEPAEKEDEVVNFLMVNFFKKVFSRIMNKDEPPIMVVLACIEVLGAYDLGVVTPRALVYAGLMTSGDARSWYMISGDAKSWVLSVFAYYSWSY